MQQTTAQLSCAVLLFFALVTNIAVLIAGQGRSVAVAIAGLRKVFMTTDNAEKHAVDGLTLSMENGHVTALLGTLIPSTFVQMSAEFSWLGTDCST